MNDSQIIQPPATNRAALDPTEFGLAFGKSKSWAYHMIYSGKIRTIQGLGSIMIPVSEIERITSQACEHRKTQPKRKKKAQP